MALTRITKGVIKPNENYDTHNINSTGIITAVGANFTGNVSVGGVLTYEDVSSIDAVGIITANQGIHVGAGVSAVGVGTFGSLDIGGDIDVDGHTNVDNLSIAGVTTFSDNDIHFKNNGITSCRYDSHLGRFNFNHSGGLQWYKNGNLSNSSGAMIFYSEFANQYKGLVIHAPWQGQNNAKNVTVMGSSNGRFYVQHNLNAQETFSAYFEGGVHLGYYQSGTKLSTTTTGIRLYQDLTVDRNALITGISTFTGAIDANGDLDVDGHTNLDNTTIAGITTFTNVVTKFKANNGGNTHLQILSTGSGEAGIFFDAANGDIAGSDYAFIGQQNNLDFVIKANPNAGNIDFQRGTDTKVRIDTSGNLNVNYDLDVDGHTNLDNVSISGVTTTTDTIRIQGDNKYLTIGAGNDIGLVHTGGESFITNATGHLTHRSDVHKWENFAGSSEYLRILSGGNIGIGTVSASALLHLHKASGDIIQKIESSNGAAALELRHTNGYGYINYFQDGAETFRVGQIAQFTSYSVYNPNSSLPYQFCVEGNGEVGINTHNPANTLHLLRNTNHGITLQKGGTNPGSALIQVASYGALNLEASNNLTLQSGGSQQIFFNRGGTTVAKFDTSGRFGINQSTPASRLHISEVGSNTITIQLTNATTGHTAGQDGMTMGYSTNSTAGFINVCESGSDFTIKTGGTAAGNERLRITSTGNIGVAGATGTDFSLLDGMVINTANGSAGLIINSSSSSHNAYMSFGYGSGSGTSHADQYSAYIGRVGDNTLIFGTNNNIRAQVTSDGHVVPGANSSYDLGLTGTKWRNVFATDFKAPDGNTNGFYVGNSDDLHLFHNGQDTYLENDTGHLNFTNKNSNKIIFRTTTSETERVSIQSNGKVTIGDPAGFTPVGLLHLYQATNDPYLYIQKGNAGDSAVDIGGIYFKNSTNSLASIYCRSDDINDGNIIFQTMNNGSLGERLRIENDGKLIVKNAELQIESSAAYNTHLNYNNIGTNYITSANGTGTYFRGSSNGINPLTVLGSGNVGINETSPSSQLVVKATTDDNPAISFYRQSTAGDIAALIWKTAAGNQAMINYRGGSGNEGMQFYVGGTSSGAERVRFQSSNFKEIIFPQQNSSTYASRVYFTEVSTNANSYVKFATITGPSFRTHIKMSCTSTISNVVTNAEFDIQVGHYQDIFVTSRSLDYTQMAIQIKSDANQNYDLYMRRSGGANSSSFSTHKVAIHPQLFEQVSFNSNINYNTTTHEHGTLAGTMRITASGGPDGNFRCQGSITKGSGSFTIPHPHPSKKSTHNLNHSFIEGPQCDNIYRGKVTLSSGGATVNLDTVSNMTEGTFVLLNRDVQCFTTNETGWGAIKGSVSGNVLTIAAQDSSSTDTISWMVVGERQDDTIKSSILTDSDGNLKVESLIEGDYDTSNLHQYYPT